MKNYYATLEVPVGSDIGVIRESYRRLVQENLWNKEVFADLKEAYEVLTTPARRHEYDQATFGQTFAGDDSSSDTNILSEGAKMEDKNRHCPMKAGIQCPVLNSQEPLSETYCPECGILLASMPSDGFDALADDTDITLLPRFEEPQGARVFRLRPGINGVGREAADILLTDKTVSRRHAQVELTEDGRAYVEDLGSTNSSRIGETILAPHTRHEIGNDDVVRFGSVYLKLKLPQGESAAPSADNAIALGGSVDKETEPAEAMAPARAQLLGSREGALVRKDPLVPGVTTFGRRAENTVVLRDDPFISSVHAQILDDGESFRLTDLGSTNGTFHNGNRLVPNDPVLLSPGDEIKIGGMLYEFELLETEEIDSEEAPTADNPELIAAESESENS